MGEIVQRDTIPLSTGGGSVYLLLEPFARKFLTEGDELNLESASQYEAHVEYSINKKGEHYMAIWIEKKK